jgi:hypothetical protein
MNGFNPTLTRWPRRWRTVSGHGLRAIVRIRHDVAAEVKAVAEKGYQRHRPGYLASGL